MDGVAPSHLGLLSPLCRSRRLCGGATLTSERQGPLSQGRTVLYATRPKPPAQLIRATRSADGSVVPFRAETFDFVSCQFALRHMANKAKMLRETYRVLRAGRRFVIRNV